MYDSGKIIAGLAVFLVLFGSPFWYDAFSGSALQRPDLVLPSGPNGKECVAGTAFMRRNHMILLNRWRNEVVREGKTFYTSSTGKVYKMRLARTCLACHGNASQFCDRCHAYVGVNPYCWECHNQRGVSGQGAMAAGLSNYRMGLSKKRLAPYPASTLRDGGRDKNQGRKSRSS